MSEMEAIVKEFVQESSENLDQLDRDLIELEKDPSSKDLLGRVFRTVHSIKGATGFLGFGKLGEVAHVGENLLSRLRDGALVLNPEMTTGLLSMVDAIRKMLSEIAATGKEGDGDYAALVDTLTRLQDGVHAGKDPPLAAAPLSGDSEKDDQAGGAPREHRGPSAPPIAGGSLRVNVIQLDNLMNLVGELVLARNQILQICSRQEDALLLATSQRLNLLTSELQESVAKVRMQPIDNIWHKFPRLVRDLTVQCGKQVRMEMQGKETELDKAIVEAIQDPLTHLVRNAVDHGIEIPDARLAAGKPVEGRLILRAFHENGQVNIEISDDGAGIDVNRVRQKAINSNLITPEKARLLNERDAMNLIFLPGISTAQTVTSISGRGVGMDVVKKNIEKIGGTVDIQSTRGAGTTTRIRLPLTLAVVPALLVSTGGDRYAIPQVGVVELVRLDKLEEKGKIENIQGISFYRLREELLLLTYLDSLLQVSALESAAAREGKTGATGVIVVLQAHDQKFGLVVDQVIDTEEIVVRPVGKYLKSISIFAGATILGDGRVALILDVPALARRISVTSDICERDRSNSEHESQEGAAGFQALLILEGPDNERIALPLSQVTRLEVFPRSQIETVGSRELIQYGKAILPLFSLHDLLAKGHLGENILASAEDARVQVVVCTKDGHDVGLLVDHVLDIVEHEFAGLDLSSGIGASAPTVIEGRITRVLNLPEILRASEPGLPKPPALEEVGA